MISVRQRDLSVADAPLPLAEHLAELRRRLLISLGLWLGSSAAAWRYSDRILTALARPAGELVFLAPTEAFYTRLKVALLSGFLLALPLLLHQAWLFVARALSPGLRRMALRLVPVSYLLFLAGASLGFFAVVPAAMRFLLSYGAENVRPLMTLGAYLDFAGGLCLAFGVVFQTPLILYFLGRLGWASREGLLAQRRYAYLICFALAALLTPGPDAVLQIALALPAVLLFEIGLRVMRP